MKTPREFPAFSPNGYRLLFENFVEDRPSKTAVVANLAELQSTTIVCQKIPTRSTTTNFGKMMRVAMILAFVSVIFQGAA